MQFQILCPPFYFFADSEFLLPSASMYRREIEIKIQPHFLNQLNNFKKKQLDCGWPSLKEMYHTKSIWNGFSWPIIQYWMGIRIVWRDCSVHVESGRLDKIGYGVNSMTCRDFDLYKNLPVLFKQSLMFKNIVISVILINIQVYV